MTPTPPPALRGWRVRGKSSDRSGLITYADGMSVSSHAVCAQISPLPPTTAEGTRRRPLSETATRSRKLGGAQTHHHRRDRGWMTLRVYARVASRLSTTSAQLSGTHANARTHGHWGVPSFLPVAQGYHNNTPPDCWHEPLSSTT